MRDYMMTDATGKQVLPSEIGGLPPSGAVRSLAGAGITCDVCHNIGGSDVNRSFQGDGFANMSLLLNHSLEKVGPIQFPGSAEGRIPCGEQRSIEDLTFAQCGAVQLVP